MPKALVVDDSKAVRIIIGRTLKELGYEVGEAGNGLQALDVLAAGPGSFSLVLADWNMPEMNGFELLLALRRKPEYSSLVIVMVTTETEVGQMSAALEAGANEYIMKPFTKDVLLEKLELLGFETAAHARS
jgi:two-component system chemotaxis response regulator CheY